MCYVSSTCNAEKTKSALPSAATPNIRHTFIFLPPIFLPTIFLPLMFLPPMSQPTIFLHTIFLPYPRIGAEALLSTNRQFKHSHAMSGRLGQKRSRRTPCWRSSARASKQAQVRNKSDYMLDLLLFFLLVVDLRFEA